MPRTDDGTCTRCKGDWGRAERCRECGVHEDTPVMSRNSMRRRKIGGKRGRNSGNVSQHGKK